MGRFISPYFVALVALSGCERDAPEAPPDTTEAEPSYEYSPFVVEVSGPVPFDAITFKDVGMSIPPDDRTFVYEDIAQSLSHELMRSELPIRSRVQYSAVQMDPDHHLHCEARHVYVDLWHEASSVRWGYSLWSGCGTNDRFEWREMSIGPGPPVRPVTRAIAGSIRQAVRTGCFRRHC